MKNNIFINRNFAFLWMGKIISQIGDKFYAIALAWWILQKTNSPGIMGFFLFISVLPGLLLGFYAGAMVDRINRKNVLILTDIIRGVLVLGIMTLSVCDLLTVWHVFVAGAILSLITAFFDPAAQAIIPQLVDREDLQKANSMNQMVTGLCTVLGPLLGAAAVSIVGIAYVFLINGISYLVSAVFEMMVRYRITPPNEKNDTNSIFNDMKEGILFLKSNGELLSIIFIIGITHFFMGSLMVLLPFLAKNLSGSGVNNLGYLEAMLGVGLLIGAIYIGKKKHDTLKMISLIFIIMFIGICFFIISLFQFINLDILPPYLLSFILIGCGISGASVYWQSLIQLQTPNHMTGRVFSISTLTGNVALPIAYGLFGIFLTYCPINVLMLFCGSCLILLSCILLLCRTFNNKNTRRIFNNKNAS